MVYICQSQSPNSSQPPIPPLASLPLFSSLCLYFCFANRFICYHFSRFHVYVWTAVFEMQSLLFTKHSQERASLLTSSSPCTFSLASLPLPRTLPWATWVGGWWGMGALLRPAGRGGPAGITTTPRSCPGDQARRVCGPSSCGGEFFAHDHSSPAPPAVRAGRGGSGVAGQGGDVVTEPSPPQGLSVSQADYGNRGNDTFPSVLFYRPEQL